MIIESSKVVRKYKAGYEIREELWKLYPDDPEPTLMREAYTPKGDYIGKPKWAHQLCKVRGIAPEKISPTSRVCSIGFCEKEQKWYGWSHRAIYGFGIGSTCKKGDIHYIPGTPQELYKEYTTPDENGFAYKKPEEVEITDKGIRVRVDMCKPSSINPLVYEDCEPKYYEVECGRGEWEAKTLEDAKQMAIDFARGVS